MKYAPLISIIITSHNYQRFLADAIESALGQIYISTEVIIVDDGSTDESRTVIERYGNRVDAVYKPNGGQASAFNTGFARSRGEVVIFLDADDVLLPTTAARVVNAFSVNPALSKVMYRMEVIDEGGRRTGAYKPASHLPLLSGDLRQYVLSFADDMTWMATSGNAFSTKTLRLILPMPEHEYRTCADWYLSLISPLYGQVEFLSDVGAYYRVHGRNNYEQMLPTIDMRRIKQTICYSETTRRYIGQTADRLNLREAKSRGKEIQSVSSLANRLIALKLASSQYPIRGDTAWHLTRSGIRVAFRRFDVSWLMRLAFIAWFLCMMLAPKFMARRLAEWFLFPEKRRVFNKYARLLRHSNKPVR